MNRLITILTLLVFVLSGCANKSNFHVKETKNFSGTGSQVVMVEPINDKRTGNQGKELDKDYDGDLLKDVQVMFEKELLKTNLFRQLVHNLDDTDVMPNIVITPSLNELKWEVPNYEFHHDLMIALSLFTGLVAAGIYGATDIDVYGDADFHVLVREQSSNRTILDKNYPAQYKEERAKWVCDRPSVKMEVAGRSLQRSMEAISSDLKKILQMETAM